MVVAQSKPAIFCLGLGLVASDWFIQPLVAMWPGDKTDPDNLLTIEYHPCLHSPDAWLDMECMGFQVSSTSQ